MSDETTLLPCPWCGKRQAIHKEFGGWILNTTSHDRKCIMRKLLSFGMGGGLVFTSKAEAIAAWNTRAELGSGTCCIVKTPSDSDFSDDWRYRCSECGCNIPVNERDPETGDVINAANFCPNCGKRVSA